MFRDILIGVASTLISALVVSLAKSVIKNVEQDEMNATPPKKPHPKKAVYRQFLICLFLFTISLALAVGVRVEVGSGALACLKIVAALSAGYNFIFLWGAFDAALVYYPPDDIKAPSDNGTEQQPDHN